MNISIEIPNAQHFIRSYKPGQITVNETVYSKSVIIAPQALITDWPPQSLGDLTADHLKSLLKHKPDLILLGTGLKHQFPSSALLSIIYQAHIGLEIMSTEAACRTYNILADEGRNVLAGLIIQ